MKYCFNKVALCDVFMLNYDKFYIILISECISNIVSSKCFRTSKVKLKLKLLKIFQVGHIHK